MKDAIRSHRKSAKQKEVNRYVRAFGLLAAVAIISSGPTSSRAGPLKPAPDQPSEPIVLSRQGAFEIGGKVLGDENASLHCDHGYVEYAIPVRPRKIGLFMWHSSSATVWQSRWDGGEGYQSIFLRRGFPVYLWDGPRVGRANWGCEATSFTPTLGSDQRSFDAWRLGKGYLNWFPDVQFPKEDPDAWEQAARKRYVEFDTVENAQLESDAAAKAVDRVGGAVLVTNSAGGFRALLTALKSDNVRAIVAYENPGYVYPEGEGPQQEIGPFGPVYVSEEAFKKFAKIPMQFVWGDNIEGSQNWEASLERCKRFVALVNSYGGKAEILHLPDAGLKGNTHIPFADLNNVQVADQLSKFLAKHHLDRR
ncbi:MAG TPA: alpha/beta fold hydrolase [Sphingobium sp.]|nr:alpha/beta fold hydrolase [Sphingobium sp.]